MKGLASAAGLAVAASAQAAPVIYVGTLSGIAESPPNASPAGGQTAVTADSVAHTLRLQGSFNSLLGTATAAHIHCCTADPGLSTAPVATTTPAFAGFPLGVAAGSYDQTLDMTSSASYNPAFVTSNGGIANAETALLTGIAVGKAYLNIHSTVFPGGEIRSFLIADSIFRNGLESS